MPESGPFQWNGLFFYHYIRGMKHTVEVIATTVHDALEAKAGGADRLEVCCALSTGGLTPSPSLFLEIKKAVDLPLFVLIRPREGDFIYSEKEIDVILADIAWFKNAGASGIVCGVNTPEGGVDIEKMTRIVDAAGDLPVTFHRAIDVCVDPIASLEDVIDLGCARVLTSGGRPKLDMTGIAVVHEMAEIAAEANVIILPGGGINKDNIELLLEHPYIIEYHHSAKKPVTSPIQTDVYESNYHCVDKGRVRLRE